MTGRKIKRVIILTGSELRHDFFRKYIASKINGRVELSCCESKKGNVQELIASQSNKSLRSNHLLTREKTEKDFFGLFCEEVKDSSNPIHLEKGEVNNDDIVNKIIQINPDIIVAYGCSIVKSELLNKFKGQFINVHLGISPYYRGAGTNYWPYVNNELACVGTTFMHINEGIDTGDIIHQIRAEIYPDDTIHQTGMRLIANSAKELVKMIDCIDDISNDRKKHELIETPVNRYYKKKDFTEASLTRAMNNIASGMVNDYLSDKINIDQKFPIITNNILAGL